MTRKAEVHARDSLGEFWRIEALDPAGWWYKATGASLLMKSSPNESQRPTPATVSRNLCYYAIASELCHFL